jgi:hypothetical protein
MQQLYGGASAQDLYRMFIGSGALEASPHWRMIDDEDGPVSDDWYVVVDAGAHDWEVTRYRLDAARIWMAVCACASRRVRSVPFEVYATCEMLMLGRELGKVEVGWSAAIADTVMQVALHGQVNWPVTLDVKEGSDDVSDRR